MCCRLTAVSRISKIKSPSWSTQSSTRGTYSFKLGEATRDEPHAADGSVPALASRKLAREAQTGTKPLFPRRDLLLKNTTGKAQPKQRHEITRFLSHADLLIALILNRQSRGKALWKLSRTSHLNLHPGGCRFINALESPGSRGFRRHR